MTLPQFSFEWVIRWLDRLLMITTGLVVGLETDISEVIEDNLRIIFGIEISMPSWLDFSILEIFYNDWIIVIIIAIALTGFIYNNIIRPFNPFD